jgi:tRNA(Ile)-lysidine synthase
MFIPRLEGLGDVDGAVVVGCSGGADSLALLALLTAAGHEVHAVHVDHGLRPDRAHDAAVVAAAAARFGASCEVVPIEIGPGGNLEGRARELRHAALESVRIRRGAAVVALGHTRDDQAETVLLNLLRGSATSGLAGIPLRRDHVVHPLLGFRRAETREICARLGLAPVHDTMNDDVRHRRVWLRREIMPALERDARRDLVDVLARQAALLRDDDEYLDARARELLDDPFDAAKLNDAPLPLARRAVRQWLGAPPPASGQVEAVLDVARGARRAAQLPGNRRVERTNGALHLVDPAHASAPPQPVTLTLPGRAGFGAYDFEAWIEHAPPARWPDGRLVAVLDADCVGPSVSLAAPAPGARFRPIGRSGSKLVADALREAGVAASARAGRPVVVSPAGAVFWVVGYRIDDHAKVTARTQRFLWIAAEPRGPLAPTIIDLTTSDPTASETTLDAPTAGTRG